MRGLTVKYLARDKRNDHFLYRRRVPKALQGTITGGEYVRVLGKTQGEALTRYGTVHGEFEHLLALAKNGVKGLSPASLQDALRASFRQWGADPHSPGKTDQERTWREAAADKLLAPYEDPATGRYVGVPEGVHAEASALLSGLPKARPAPTITDAFKFYLAENAKPIPEQRRKQEQRFRRAERGLISATGEDKLLAELTREDARKWRDMRLQAGVAPTTVHRERKDISAVISTAISELGGVEVNPFLGLKMPASETARQEERHPLPLGTIEGVYGSLQREPTLLALWTLLDFTGARPSEVRQLVAGDVNLTDPVPHIMIHEGEGRTLKTSWSTRRVPLVGEALGVAGKLVERCDKPSDPLFPHFATEGGMDRLSKALIHRVRKFTSDPKHVPYSLRHNMKDRLRAAEVSPQVQNALMGHAAGQGEEARYGAGLPLAVLLEGFQRALRGYRGA